MDSDWSVKEIVEPESGKVHRLYTYRGKVCKRIPLSSHLATQMAGYILIEKDLRSVGVWLQKIDELQSADAASRLRGHKHAKDREIYNIIKGLFVAALTFYGKAFAKCEGRRIKLERSHVAPEFHAIHDESIAFRNNFAAHSGAKKLEWAEVALVIAPKSTASPKLYREMTQPDVTSPSAGKKSFAELSEHARSLAVAKLDQLHQKIMAEEVLPKGYDFWSKK